MNRFRISLILRDSLISAPVSGQYQSALPAANITLLIPLSNGFK